MKKVLLYITIFVLIATGGFSQGGKKDGGRLEAYKIAYLTKTLNLSVDEAQKFWPIYNNYVNEIMQVKIEHRNMDEITFEEKVVNIRRKYKTEFSQALPGERVNQFFKADKEFNNVVRRELQDRELKQLRQQNTRSFKQ